MRHSHGIARSNTARMLAIATNVLVLIGVGPRVAGADEPFTLNSVCSTAALQLCAAVEVSVAPNPSGMARILTLRVRNLEGSLGLESWLRTASASASAPNALDGWFVEGRANGGLGAEAPGFLYTVVGCDTPVSDDHRKHRQNGFIRACGGSGWVEFTFSLQGFWSAPDGSQPTLTGSYADAVADSTVCEVNPDSDCEPTETQTPTNAIVAYILSGFVGVRWLW